jgi:hypothetical protein
MRILIVASSLFLLVLVNISRAEVRAQVRAQGYQLSLKNEYLSKEDANLIFKMSRTQWNEAVTNLVKKNGIKFKVSGPEDLGFQYWEAFSNDSFKMVHAGYGDSYQNEPIFIVLQFINRILSQKDFDTQYQLLIKYFEPEFKVVGFYNDNTATPLKSKDVLFTIGKSK